MEASHTDDIVVPMHETTGGVEHQERTRSADSGRSTSSASSALSPKKLLLASRDSEEGIESGEDAATAGCYIDLVLI